MRLPPAPTLEDPDQTAKLRRDFAAKIKEIIEGYWRQRLAPKPELATTGTSANTEEESLPPSIVPPQPLGDVQPLQWDVHPLEEVRSEVHPLEDPDLAPKETPLKTQEENPPPTMRTTGEATYPSIVPPQPLHEVQPEVQPLQGGSRLEVQPLQEEESQ
jgi:hypothetical protein